MELLQSAHSLTVSYRYWVLEHPLAIDMGVQTPITHHNVRGLVLGGLEPVNE